MTATLRASPDLIMFIEFEPPALEAAGESPQEFLHHLRSIFRVISVIDDERHTLVPLNQGGLAEPQSLLCSRVRTERIDR